MTSKARFTVPYLDATVVEYLDTGSGMNSQGELVRVLSAKENTYTVPSDTSLTYPNAHTVRLRVTLPEARAVDRIVIEGIQQTTGLSYTVDSGDGTSMSEIVSSTSISAVDDYSVSNVIVRVSSPSAATTYDIDITGMTQEMQIEGVMLGHDYFVPTFNFDFNPVYREAPVSEVVSTMFGNNLRFVDSSRSKQLVFSDLTETEYKTFRNMYKNKLVAGYCLFEQNQTTEEDWFLAVMQMESFSHPQHNSYTVQVSVFEVNACP